MSDKPISPLRRRMIEDMTVRNFVEKTRNDYIRHVRTFTAFLGRAPDTAAPEDLRLFQLHQTQTGVRAPSINGSVAALRFFFTVTLDRPEMARHLTFVREPRKIPVVLSLEEIARLLEAAPGPKYKAALSAAYGAGLRVSEVVALKVSDIDSERMLLRIEQGKGRKDRFAMLSPRLLELLRDWYRIARPAVWLFPGRDPLLPLTTRQFNRVVHAAADRAAIKKRVTPHTLRHSFATHLLEEKTDVRLIQVLLGHAKLDTTALYAQVATNVIRAVMSPFDRLTPLTSEKQAAGISHGAHGSSGSGGRGYLPRPWPGMAQANAGHVSLGQLKVMSAIESCRTAALGGHVMRCEDCSHTHHRLQQLPQSALPEVPGRGRHWQWLSSASPNCWRCRTSTSCSRCRRAIADIAYQNKAVVYDLLFKASAETMLHDCGRPQASGRSHRHHLGAAHLGLGDDPSSARAHDRAGWWDIARRHALDRLPSKLLLPVKVLSRLFRRLMLEKLLARTRRPPAVLRRPRPPRRQGRVQGLSRAAASDQVVRLYQAPVRRAAAGARLSVALHPPRRDLQQPPHRRRRDRRHLQVQGLPDRGPGRYKTMTLKPDEFIRRFLIHVLPNGFHRIRHCGLLAERHQDRDHRAGPSADRCDRTCPNGADAAGSR